MLQGFDDWGCSSAEALGDLDHDTFGVEKGVFDRAAEPVVSVGVEVERAWTQVEEEQSVLRKKCGAGKRALDADEVEVVYTPHLLGDVEGLRRARQPVIVVRPDERLDAEQSA